MAHGKGPVAGIACWHLVLANSGVALVAAAAAAAGCCGLVGAKTVELLAAAWPPCAVWPGRLLCLAVCQLPAGNACKADSCCNIQLWNLGEKH